MKPRILFLCTGNSCRSQMAEGWGHDLRSDIDWCSAGVETHGLNPHAVKVMAEAGVDITSQTSQHIDDFELASLNLVVTVCDHAQQSCPSLPGTVKVLHHPFDDPPRLAKELEDTEDKLDCFRRVRDEIRSFVEGLEAV